MIKSKHILKKICLSHIGITILVAIAYYIFGRLGLLLALPPGYATAIWAPAGIAAGAILLFGYRTAFGIFIGSFAVNIWTSAFVFGNQFDRHEVWATTLLVALFSMFQAIVIRFVICKTIGLSNSLIRPKNILLFSLISGPICCTVSATLCVTTLWLYKFLPIGQVATTWLTWWVGDNIGVLILTPILIILFGTPRQYLKKRLYVIGLPLIILFACVVVFFFVTKQTETNREHLVFQHQVAGINGRLTTQLEKTKYILKSLNNFFHGSNFISRKEFHDYLEQTLHEDKSIQAISWIPQVPYSEVKTYTQDAHKDGLATFRITQRINGLLVRDIKRPYYYPVYYIEPYASNKKALGFNLGSNAKRLAAMEHARQTNKMIASEPVKLVQEKEGKQYAIIIFAPIVKDNKFMGYTTGIYRLKDLLHVAIPSEKSKLFSIYLNGPHASQQFSYINNTLLKLTQQHSITNSLKHTSFHTELPIQIGHEIWTIYYIPSLTYLGAVQFWFTWTILAGGLLFVILLSLLLLTLSGQNQAIQEEVSNKTNQLKRISLYDTLTDTPNRAYFFETLNEYFSNPTKHPYFALMYIDVDNFKSINDTYGHYIGDEFLKGLVNKLHATTRKSDFFARVGGDEFALICKNVKNYTEAKKIAKHLIKVCKHNPIKTSNYELKARISLGIALYPKAGQTQEELISNADIAMYHAKKLGGDQLQCFNQKLAQKYHRRAQIRRELVNAQANNELSMYYQPVIDAHSSHVIAIEALLRWNHPELGFIPPDEFIPIAESSGHIIKIGDWIIDSTIKEFSLLGPNLSAISKDCILTVNVSAVQLCSEKLVNHILQTLKKYSVPPKKLLIELTETALIENIKNLHTMLEHLGKAKVMIALDDFGSGYSSLNYLQRLPIDIIKIDREFIKDLPQDTDSLAIVKTIIELAKNINAKLIAEGVETKDQAKLLGKLNCDYLQGYYFARPMPAEELVGWLKEHGK